MITNREAATALEEYLRPATFPVAVKLSGEPSLPARARRPLDFLGHPVAVCQGISMARSIGGTVGFLKEDHACAPSFVALGLAEEPEMVKSGDLVYPLYGSTPEACARTQVNIPNLPVGKVQSIVIAPLAKAEFEPDIILVYGLPAQVARLIQGALYREGGVISSSFVGRNSCGAELVAPLLEQKCQVVVPGSGERLFAHTQDHEMCFAIPAACLEDVTTGLVASHKAGGMRFPTPYQGLRARPKFPEKYHALEKMFDIQ